MIAAWLPMPSAHAGVRLVGPVSRGVLGLGCVGGAVLKGDVGATPLSDVLNSLAADGVTGCLHIDDGAGDEALVYFKDGLVYSAYVPGRRPQLGARLISSGALAPEALAEALDAQTNELQGWRLGELLVHLGYVERPVVEAFVLEQLREACFDLSRWTSGRFRFRKNEKTREDVGSHAAVADLLAEVDRRRGAWDVITEVVHGPGAVPVLSGGGISSAEMTLDQDQWALLCKVDGERTIAELARDCGFTTFEAGQIVYALVSAGLLDVEEVFEESSDAPEPEQDMRSAVSAIASVLAAPDEVTPAQRISSALIVPLVPPVSSEPEVEPEEPPSEVARLLSASAPDPETALPQDLRSELASLTAAIADLPSLALPAEPEYPTMPDEPVDEPVVEAVAEPVVEAVAEPVVEEPAPEPAPTPAPVVDEDDPFGDSLARVSEALSALLGDALPAVSLPEATKVPEPTPEEIEAARREAEALERSRAAAAAELAEAHAMAEAARAPGRLRFGRKSKVEERQEAERRAAEQAAADEAARAEAARAEAERVAAEQAAAEEAARVEAERVAAEEAAHVEAERVAAEEAAGVEAERVAAEQAAAEEAARAEADRLAAEQAAAEEAARAEADRLAAEQAAAEEAARAEAERLAAEQAAEEIARLAAEETERAAADQAERLAAEEAARAEAERLAEESAAEEAADAVEDVPEVDTFEVTAMLRDIGDADVVETIEEYVPDDAPAEAPAEPEPAFANGSRAGLSETAALLRELTSLGIDDDAEPSGPRGPQPPRQNAPKEQPKKRKGLFGRG
jgi:hypothetical protein